MNKYDMLRLRTALAQPTTPIECAGIQPTSEQLEMFMQAITLELEANRVGKAPRKAYDLSLSLSLIDTQRLLL